jgi:hypothetical protein
MSQSDSDPTRNTLFQIQKFSAGEISKNMQRVFWAGRSAGLPAQAAGLGSHFLLEMGSNFVVKLSHIKKPACAGFLVIT